MQADKQIVLECRVTERVSLDIDSLIDGQRLGASALFVAILAFFVLVCDGFDLAALGYVAPQLLNEWHLPAERMVPAYSTGIIGLMVGGPLVGALGDRFGRRPMMLGCLATMGLSTLVATAARDVPQLAALRLLTGVALGGALPIAGSLIAEVCPARHRGRLLTLVLTGPAIGIALSGMITAALVPRFGWRSLLVSGGLLPLGLLVAALRFLPESVRFLASRPDRKRALMAAVRRLRPDLDGLGDVSLTDTEAHRLPLKLWRPGELFSGDLRFVTPMFWIAQVAIQTSSFFALTWLPTLLQASGASVAYAGLNASLFSIGGLVSSLLLLVTIDRLGALMLAVLLLIGAPLMAILIGYGFSPTIHAAVIFGAGFCIIGSQLCITVLLGLYYPPAIRAFGTGSTQAVGRLGALAAPVGGGLMIETGVTLERLPMAPAALLVVGASAATVIAWIGLRRYGSVRPREIGRSILTR